MYWLKESDNNVKHQILLTAIFNNNIIKALVSHISNLVRTDKLKN